MNFAHLAGTFKTSQRFGTGGPPIFIEMVRQGGDAIRSLYLGSVDDLKAAAKTHDLRWAPSLSADFREQHGTHVQNVVTTARIAVMQHSAMFGPSYGEADLMATFADRSVEAQAEAATNLESFIAELRRDEARKKHDRKLRIQGAIGGAVLAIVAGVIVEGVKALLHL